jgi:hypothetical protein
MVLSLFGCTLKKDKVEASICHGDECFIIHTEGKEKRLVSVTPAMFKSCKVDYQWPECGDGIHNGMRVTQLDNDPYRNTRRDEQNRNSRTVCVQSVSDPEVMITNSWWIGDMDKKIEKPKTQGIVYKGGQKWPIDFVITQALGDCTAQARVPE